MPINITPEQVLLLADAHIEMYKKRLASGRQDVNVPETTHYLWIWESIQAKKGTWLTREETTEVRDAVESGDFDDLLETKPKEQ